MMGMRRNVFLASAALASTLVLGAGVRSAHAHANFLPSIKVGGGWVSVVSYVDTQVPNNGVFVRVTHQSKVLTNLTDPCTHLDGQSPTTVNDLTTTVLKTPGGGIGNVFPAADTVGGGIINPAVIPGDPTSEGFMVIQNYDGTGVLGPDGTLTSEALVFNLGSGFLTSERALAATDTPVANGFGFVTLDAPLCGTCNYLPATPFSAGAATVFGNTTAGTLTRFMFLPPARASTTAYAVAVNRQGTAEASDGATTVNLVDQGYTAEVNIAARLDATQGYALGIYDRLENFRSLTQSNDIVCIATLSPDQLTGGTIPTFIANGGWTNLSPSCLENDGGLQICNGNAAGVELGDAADLYKIEFSAGVGFAVTPLQQQWYAK